MKSSRKGLKAVATIEASKGLISLLVGFGVHKLAGHNVQQMLESLLTHLHLNPANRLPGILLNDAAFFTSAKLTLIALGALVYAIVRFVEAYGLWRELVWIEWFALLSGGIYLPFEMYEVIKNTGAMSIAALIINLVIVLYLYWVVRDKSRIKAS